MSKQGTKTKQRVDGRHQRMVSDRHANTQHHGAGQIEVEMSSHGGIGHQRVQAHEMKKRRIMSNRTLP